MTAPLWQPSPERIAGANLTAFMAQCERDWGVKLSDYDALYDWSVTEIEKFWASVWDFCGVIAETRGETVLADGDKMPGARFFPDARLNFAENLLRRRDEADAMVFRGEDRVRRSRAWPRRFKPPASAKATGSPASCPICRRPRSGPWPPVRSAPSGRPAHPTSAFRACSTASARSSPRC
jgi:hypothetical protein